MVNAIQQQIAVDIHSLKTVTCQCGKQHFDVVNIFKVVPAIYSSKGAPELYPVPCLRCIECKSIYSVDDVVKHISKDDTEESKISVVTH